MTLQLAFVWQQLIVVTTVCSNIERHPPPVGSREGGSELSPWMDQTSARRRGF